MDYYTEKKALSIQPRLQNIKSQAFPTPETRFTKNANVTSLFGVFYLYFPSVILFAVVMLDIVKEKENLLKNYTNLYGLSNIGYWVSWLIAASVFSVIISLETIFFGRYLFEFEFFINSNIFIAFTLFFLFAFSMQLFGMSLSTMINTTKSATTVSYSLILIGIVIQSIFTNYGAVFILFAVNLNLGLYNVLLKIFLVLMHLYPPFLFSKSFLVMSRINSFHFDGPALQWVPGRYFSTEDLFTNVRGKLRIGIEYEIDSLFSTFLWFYFIIFLFLLIISFNEMKQSYRFGDKNSNNLYKDYFFKRYFRFFKKIYSLASVKKLNLIKQNIENSSNKTFDKFLKNELRTTNLNQDENLSFIMKESHISVLNEKKFVATLNKKRTIPNGLRILSISKIFENDFEALSDINLELYKGEVFTILGPNGAGKSTLINILTSQISASEGYAKLGPFMIHSDLFIDSIYVKRMIGVCSQFDYFWEELTVNETLELYSRLRGIKQEKIENYLDGKLKLVGLVEEKNNLVKNLSGGMKRRLSICISTLGDPFVIFMDEPTSGLDPNNRRRIWRLINTIKKNRVIVLTTHLMDEAEYLSDRLGVVVNGRMRFIGNCTEMRKLHLDGIILTISKIIFNNHY